MDKRVFRLGACLCLLAVAVSSCFPADIVIGCDVGELIQAIEDANDDPDHTTIVLDEGCLYNLTQQYVAIDYQEGPTTEGGYTGLPPITTEITIEGNEATIQRLNSAPEMRFFYITSTGELTLEEVTLNNGLVTTGQIGFRNGGAIYNRGILNLVSSHVLDSYAEDSGGGILNDTVGMLHIDNTSVSFNTAGAHGGALINVGETLIDGYSIINDNEAGGTGGAIMSSGDLEIYFSHVSFNQSVVRGGAISTGLQSSNIFDDVLFEGNQSSGEGGAISFITSTFTITDCTFYQNQTTDINAAGGAVMVGHSTGTFDEGTVFSENVSARGGGGLYIYGDSVVDINLTSFLNNTAAIGGGGMSSYVHGLDINVTNSTFDGNHATFGGGIANGGRMVMANSTVSNNTSTEAGAGIYNSGFMFKITNSTISGNSNQNVGGGILNYSSLKINFSTIAFNESMHGAGLYDNGDEVRIKNSIIADNTPYNCSVFAPLIALGDNLDDDGSCQGFNITADPSLAVLSNNGGPTMTHAFIFSSPAVDGVTDCTNIAGGSPITFDQRGEPRPYGAQCDLGAYEAQSTPSGFHAFVEVQFEILECLAGPDSLFDWIASYYQGDSLTALGRNEAGTWLGIAGMNGQAGEVACWVPSEGVESLKPVMGFPVLQSPDLPERPEEEEEGYNRCALFSPETYSLTQHNIPYGTGDLTLYVFMPEGVWGLEVEVPEDTEPWQYMGTLGDYADEECTFEGYAGRVFCRLEIPESYLGTVREFNLYVNGCPDPIYTHPMVTIPVPEEPVSCNESMDKDECEANGGTYTCRASGADCDCVCP